MITKEDMEQKVFTYDFFDKEDRCELTIKDAMFLNFVSGSRDKCMIQTKTCQRVELKCNLYITVIDLLKDVRSTYGDLDFAKISIELMED